MKTYMDYFEQLCKIPHGSGNTKRISDFLKKFAEERNLYSRQDAMNNIVIIKEAGQGYENHEPVILQGHMDMVAVKTSKCNKNMQEEGLDLFVEDNCLKARNTSLGGDDGIAVAYIMAIMDSDVKAPRIEAVITVDEEVGMLGASGIEVNDITAKRMINIDQEEEGVFVVSCAGGAGIDFNIPVRRKEQEGHVFRIELSGLKGGHSGVDINKNRGNAIKLMAEVLSEIYKETGFSLISFDGGDADNAIPNRVTSEIMVINGSASECNDINEKIKEMLDGRRVFLDDGINTDEGIFSVCSIGYEKRSVFDKKSTECLLALLNRHRYGIVAMDEANPDFVKTSLNPGKITTTENEVVLLSSVRSSNSAEKQNLIKELCDLAEELEIDYKVSGVYDGWDYDPDSKLRELMVSAYEDMFNKKPELEAIHAGLECGVFASKIEGLDCISIGPDIINIHSVNEYLPIDSAQRTYEYLLKVLEIL